MKTFKDLDNKGIVNVPVDLESQASLRTSARARKQKVLASALASVLLVAMFGVAFAATTSTSSSVKPADKNRSGKIKGADETSTTADAQDNQGDDTNDVSTTIETRGNDDNEEVKSTTVGSTAKHEDDDKEDDHSSTSTTEVEQETEDNHSGSNSGSDNSGSDN